MSDKIEEDPDAIDDAAAECERQPDYSDWKSISVTEAEVIVERAKAEIVCAVFKAYPDNPVGALAEYVRQWLGDICSPAPRGHYPENTVHDDGDGEASLITLKPADKSDPSDSRTVHHIKRIKQISLRTTATVSVPSNPNTSYLTYKPSQAALRIIRNWPSAALGFSTTATRQLVMVLTRCDDDSQYKLKNGNELCLPTRAAGCLYNPDCVRHQPADEKINPNEVRVTIPNAFTQRRRRRN